MTKVIKARAIWYVLKLSILIVQRLALHQNGVEFSQQSIGDIRISLATLYDDVQCRVMKSKFLVYILTHSFTKSCMEAGTLPKNFECGTAQPSFCGGWSKKSPRFSLEKLLWPADTVCSVLCDCQFTSAQQGEIDFLMKFCKKNVAWWPGLTLLIFY